MQNMNYYYDFSGQKYNHPLSLSMNSFDRKVFSRQTSLEISFVLRGSYEVVTEHISHVLREQELVVISPNEIHILKKIDPDSVILILHIDFDRIPDTLLGSCRNIFYTTICNLQNNRQLLFLLKEELRKLIVVLLQGNVNEGTDLFELNEIMMKILCITKKEQSHSFEQLPVASIHHDNYIKAIRYIDQHYHENIHLSDIAKTLSFSNSYTSRLFTKFTGLPFVKYLSYVRVRESLEYLLECKASIEEISGICGMPNSKAYTQIFKELYGITPSTYRKRFLKNLLPLPGNEARPMDFTKEQKELMNHVFQLDNYKECLYRSKDVAIEKKGDTLLCTLANHEEHEFHYVQKRDRVLITIHPVAK
ncbi:helix-turn-helix domain-containing protein [[Clostridium] scindens]|uniref:Bifunctional transcriptional activator/DNA repair enzyme AdaA n=1 Tax=Clostridium scindens (strain ATCC 35704 / DSM 5676 / VPI 13733 / 19) TaxID=411468 RepID=A0A494WIF1_CLOS5|nr:AraC family transcriptional regulator [[Clostridium] scindens]QBF73952.1 Bifunctional transcriptional activator/DNA repair enzyme AdaA [[Clostridium] scindens ATCC 35704]QRO37238.1 helix-turn-helix transcriptional regulator [[Clostridium] scindens]WPB36668.1 HTH-type transcriptional activator RhaR [[Clostridium] scindens]BDF14879.1 hypothetical protein CE91St59_01420 [[Clostridium] scindens]BDF18563.1 hypothetical protein CE91St60_01460 [[Clostridium] scindens]